MAIPNIKKKQGQQLPAQTPIGTGNRGQRVREYDYVIVGAGTAGCVIASRISANNDSSVLLVEAGPRDKNPNIHRPAGLFKLFDGSLTWNYQTVPQANLNGRHLPLVQGRVLGGGSSVNGQAFTRGSLEDYDG